MRMLWQSRFLMVDIMDHCSTSATRACYAFLNKNNSSSTVLSLSFFMNLNLPSYHRKQTKDGQTQSSHPLICGALTVFSRL